MIWFIVWLALMVLTAIPRVSRGPQAKFVVIGCCGLFLLAYFISNVENQPIALHLFSVPVGFLLGLISTRDVQGIVQEQPASWLERFRRHRAVYAVASVVGAAVGVAMGVSSLMRETPQGQLLRDLVAFFLKTFILASSYGMVFLSVLALLKLRKQNRKPPRGSTL
jgi:hypothetical protein